MDAKFWKNIRHVGQFWKFCLRQESCAFKWKEIVQYLKAINITKLTKTILKSSTSYIYIENTKQTFLFLWVAEFWPTFDLQTSMNFVIFWEKLQSYTFAINQIFGQRFIIFKNEGIAVNYCWNYGSSKLLLYFIECRLD